MFESINAIALDAATGGLDLSSAHAAGMRLEALSRTMREEEANRLWDSGHPVKARAKDLVSPAIAYSRGAYWNLANQLRGY